MPRPRPSGESLDSGFHPCDGGYRSIVQRTPCLIARYDSRLRVCFVNQAVVRTSGIPRQEWLGRTTEEAGIPGGRLGWRDPGAERWARALRAALETGREAQLELEIEGLDGLRSYALHVLPERGLDGSVASIVMIGQDVTAHARAQRDLAHRERALLTALEALGAGVVEVETDGTIRSWSPAQARLTGLPEEEVVGRPIWEVQVALLPAQSRRPENRERVRSAFAALLGGAETRYQDAAVPFVVQRPDGTRRLVETIAVAGPGAADREPGARGALLITRAVEPRPRPDRPGGEHGPA